MKFQRIKLAIFKRFIGLMMLMGMAAGVYAQSAAEIGAMHNNCNHPNYQATVPAAVAVIGRRPRFGKTGMAHWPWILTMETCIPPKMNPQNGGQSMPHSKSVGRKIASWQPMLETDVLLRLGVVATLLKGQGIRPARKQRQ